MGRCSPRLKREGWNVWVFLCRCDAMVGGRDAAASPRGDRAGYDVFGLLRRLVLRRRRLVSSFRGVLANLYDRLGQCPPHRRSVIRRENPRSGRQNCTDLQPSTACGLPVAPVPSRGGHSCCTPDVAPVGPLDQAEIEERADVLVYSTPALQQPIEVTGPI